MRRKQTAGWPRRWVWRGFRRYRLYGPNVAVLEDGRGGLYQAERYLVVRRAAVMPYSIDVGYLRVAPDPEKVRRQELGIHIGAMELRRREERGKGGEARWL